MLSVDGSFSGGRGSSNGTSDMSSGSSGLASGGVSCDVAVGVDILVEDRVGWEGANGGLVGSVLKGGNLSSCVTGGRPGAVLGGWSWSWAGRCWCNDVCFSSGGLVEDRLSEGGMRVGAVLVGVGV